MEFLIFVGIVGLGLYFLNQNKTERRDKTTITHKKVIQTQDGEVHVSKTQTIDSVRTIYGNNDVAGAVEKNIIPSISTHQKTQINQPNDRVILERINSSPSFELKTIQPEPQQTLLINQIGSKECPNCEKELSFNSFRKSNKYNDGLTKWCTDCLNNHQSRLPRNKKHCPKCNKTRLKSSYYKNSNREDGLTKWCKTCMDKSKRS